ncbi:hypothetical protein, partial [Gilvimarinus sp. 1_MG-2023]|uniref:hypothetical protein n=1 Tax=Gilvimarinus sp. 1_MG-2023 TaxID=3062638 RepID=UPI0026E3074C
HQDSQTLTVSIAASRINRRSVRDRFRPWPFCSKQPPAQTAQTTKAFNHHQADFAAATGQSTQVRNNRCFGNHMLFKNQSTFANAVVFATTLASHCFIIIFYKEG